MGKEKRLLIIGAGQYGFVAKETAEAIGCFDVISFIDNNSSLAIGKTEDRSSLGVQFGLVDIKINPNS